jgi:hypothetical protein
MSPKVGDVTVVNLEQRLVSQKPEKFARIPPENEELPEQVCMHAINITSAGCLSSIGLLHF